MASMYTTFIRHLIEDGLDLGIELSQEEIALLQGPSLAETVPKLTAIGKQFDTLLAVGSTCDSAFLRFANCAPPYVIRYIRQILLLNSKLRILSPNTAERQVEEFKTSQLEMRNSSLNCLPSSLQRCICRTWDSLVAGVDISVVQPKMGPGAVSEGLTHDEKWEFRSWPKRLERYYPIDWHAHGSTVAAGDEPSARLIAVPKDSLKVRLISAEPAPHQYIQQGQLSVLAAHIRASRHIRQWLRLEDQTWNQKVLRRSPQDFVTMDMSEASDRVSACLVYDLMRRNNLPLFRRLWASRSKSTTFRGSNIDLACFSPMGSAVCFPIESLVFLTLALSVCREMKISRAEVNRYLRVYGDDIIVPAAAYPLLADVLRSLGMKPNSNKTCFGEHFRESCGYEVYDQLDVTAVRNKAWQYEPNDRKADGCIISIHNKMVLYGYNRASAYIRYLNPNIPCCPTGFHHDYDGRGVMRWNKDLQREEWVTETEIAPVLAWRLPEARLAARLLGDYTERKGTRGLSRSKVSIPSV